MISNNNFECSFSDQVAQPEPNGEVGGPGVTVVVVTTAWITISTAALFHLFTFDPKRGASHDNRRTNDADEDDSAVNSVDLAVSRITRTAQRYKRSRPEWQDTFLKSLLAICDVQSLVGLSLLAGGFLSLSTGVSAYHFMLAVQTGFFAFITQLAALTVLRQDNPGPFHLWNRLIFTLIISGVLIRAILPTFFFNWAYITYYHYQFPDSNEDLHHITGGSASLPGSYAACFFDMIRSHNWHWENGKNAYTFSDTPAWGSGIVLIVFIVLLLAVRILRLWGWFSSIVLAARRMLSKQWKSLFSDTVEPGSLLQRGVTCIGLTTLLTARLFSDLLVSTLADVYWLFTPLIFATLSLTRTRSSISSIPVNDPTWTSAQILPSVLLLGSLLIAPIALLFSHSKPAPPPLSLPRSTASPPRSQSPNARPPLLGPSPRPSLLDTNSATTFTNPAIALACLQTIILTAVFLHAVFTELTNLATALAAFAVPVLVGIPASTFLFIGGCLVWDEVKGYFVEGEEREVKWWWYWVVMGGVWALTGGLFALMVFVGKWHVEEVLFYIVVGVGSGIGAAVLGAVGVVVVERVRDGRGRGGISL